MRNIVKLSTLPTEDINKKEAKIALRQMTEEIADIQHLMYAEKKHAMLVVFQGMDASGKDGSTRNVFGQCSPTGINAYSFKKPTELEFAHDFLWRVHRQAPAIGEIMIFNRSHYEDVLIQRVHKWIDEARVDARINAINACEKLLVEDNNTTILKFYLHISKDRQEEKLQERIDIPRKQWKHNPNDWEERKYWDQYMYCYQEVIDRCSVIPWHIIPVDKRWYRNYAIAKIVLHTMRNLNCQLPTTTKP